MAFRGLVPLVGALLVALVCAGPAAAARILPPGDRYGDAAIDLSTNGRAAVAYERLRPGPDLIWVAIRRADRLNRPTAGRLIGRGNLELVRVGGVASGPHLVAWKRRGELRVSVLTRGAWRTERLPAAVRPLRALSAAIAGSQAILVVGDETTATVVQRVRPGRWAARPLPPSAPRSALVARASEPSGRVAAAWTEAGVAGPSVVASAFDPGTGAWSPPATVLPPGVIPSPVPDDLSLNGRGDAALSIATSEDFIGPRPAVRPLRFLPALSTAWIALPDLPQEARPGELHVAVTPAGVPVYARGIRFASLTGGAWGAEEVSWSGPSDPDAGSIWGLDDLAVAQGGRVVLSVAVDPGPGPDDHVFVVRAPTTGTWTGPRRFGSTYGAPELVVGGRRVAASWVEDASGSGLPEAALAP